MDNKDLEQVAARKEAKNESRRIFAKIVMGVSLALALPTLWVINWFVSSLPDSESAIQFIVTEWNNGGWFELTVFFSPLFIYVYFLSLVIRLYRQKAFLSAVVLGSVLTVGSFGAILFLFLYLFIFYGYFW